MFLQKKFSPYVVALYQQAEQEGVLEQVLSDASSLLAMLSDVPEVHTFLGTPFIPDEEKTAFLMKSYGDSLSSLVVSFLTVTAQSRRMSRLKDILSIFIDYAEFQKGVQSIHVTSAFPMSSELEKRLESALVDQLKAPVHMTVDLDPTLIGGVVIRYPDYELDLSVQHKISTLQSTIKEAVV